ncbi:SymE family type I addiction module toxin [Stenotrophomonas sp. MMGLT7]|uniref:SymE family type I addiction module toxin n=1 Tax=Stenotrophomonas sp. MMGLT7 TaxID=2901227 RepID=UPI001E3A0BE4|nr:SymE family type I addiction module toxin [Stenotrophomonas sp. MMGLT7]MCD7097151.1 type I toxin-antitoxin system SymE family toxin [Stenotrophomonas sp. MMGLT7]
MRKPQSRTAAKPRKRAPKPQSPDAAPPWDESPRFSLLPPEEAAALNAAEAARKPRKPHRPRPPQHCTVGYGYYATSTQRVPALRLRGHWLEKLGFSIGSKLQIAVREGELVVTVTPESAIRE